MVGISIKNVQNNKYFLISPYAYCANNFINALDPTGMDIWEINNEGRIINRIKDRTQDAFFMVALNENGITKLNILL